MIKRHALSVPFILIIQRPVVPLLVLKHFLTIDICKFRLVCIAKHD